MHWVKLSRVSQYQLCDVDGVCLHAIGVRHGKDERIEWFEPFMLLGVPVITKEAKLALDDGGNGEILDHKFGDRLCAVGPDVVEGIRETLKDACELGFTAVVVVIDGGVGDTCIDPKVVDEELLDAGVEGLGERVVLHGVGVELVLMFGGLFDHGGVGRESGGGG